MPVAFFHSGLLAPPLHLQPCKHGEVLSEAGETTDIFHIIDFFIRVFKCHFGPFKYAEFEFFDLKFSKFKDPFFCKNIFSESYIDFIIGIFFRVVPLSPFLFWVPNPNSYRVPPGQQMQVLREGTQAQGGGAGRGVCQPGLCIRFPMDSRF